MRTTIFLILFTLCISTYSQKNKKGIDIVKNTTPIINASEIIYYGWDFSKLQITGGTWKGEPDEFKNQLNSIIGLLSARFKESTVAAYLKKDVKSNLDVIQKQYLQLNYDKALTFDEKSYTLEEIQSIVNNYILPEGTGVGLCVIAESMNKLERHAIGTVVFFDIKTREVLWANRMSGLPGSKWGFAKYWYEGYLECFYYFIDKYYKKEIL